MHLLLYVECISDLMPIAQRPMNDGKIAQINESCFGL